MIEKTIKLYRWQELSKEVRNDIIDRNNFDFGYEIMEDYGRDYEQSLKSFCDAMGIDVDYSVDYCAYHFRFVFKDDDYLLGDFEHNGMYAEDVCGKYLRRYLNKYVIDKIFPYKEYLGRYDREKRCYVHRKVSNIIREKLHDCPLSGCSYDITLLSPIVDCLSNVIKDDYSLNDLINECLDKFFEEWHKDYEYWCDNEDDCLDEWLTNCRYCDKYFYEDGTEYHGSIEEIGLDCETEGFNFGSVYINRSSLHEDVK